MPVAVNCCVVPLAMLGVIGLRAIDSRAAGLTVSTVEPLMPPSMPLIVDVPVVRPLARPCMPPALETVATAGADDAQVTRPLRSFVELSVYVPVAVNC